LTGLRRHHPDPAIVLAAAWRQAAATINPAHRCLTRIRARAVGFGYSWSRLSGVFTGFFIAFFLRNFGVVGVFLFVAASMVAVIVSVAALGPRTNNLAREAIAH
jgi:MFS transporter, putative metabolite:H+ symporter